MADTAAAESADRAEQGAVALGDARWCKRLYEAITGGAA